MRWCRSSRRGPRGKPPLTPSSSTASPVSSRARFEPGKAGATFLSLGLEIPTDGSGGRSGTVARLIWVWREGTCIQRKGLQDRRCFESSSGDAKHTRGQSGLQHSQSQQKPARRRGHHGSSSPKTLDHGSTKGPHCPTGMLLYPPPKCSYSCAMAQQRLPIPEAGSTKSCTSGVGLNDL